MQTNELRFIENEAIITALIRSITTLEQHKLTTNDIKFTNLVYEIVPQLKQIIKDKSDLRVGILVIDQKGKPYKHISSKLSSIKPVLKLAEFKEDATWHVNQDFMPNQINKTYLEAELISKYPFVYRLTH